MSKPTCCIECQASAPDSTTSYTVIGAGWRLLKKVSPSGGAVVEWRCGPCWKNYRARTPATAEAAPNRGDSQKIALHPPPRSSGVA